MSVAASPFLQLKIIILAQICLRLATLLLEHTHNVAQAKAKLERAVRSRPREKRSAHCSVIDLPK